MIFSLEWIIILCLLFPEFQIVLLVISLATVSADMMRKSIVFDIKTPKVFYCPQDKPSDMNKMIVQSRPLDKLCEYGGEGVPKHSKSDCYNDIDETEYACAEKQRIMVWDCLLVVELILNFIGSIFNFLRSVSVFTKFIASQWSWGFELKTIVSLQRMRGLLSCAQTSWVLSQWVVPIKFGWWLWSSWNSHDRNDESIHFSERLWKWFWKFFAGALAFALAINIFIF